MHEHEISEGQTKAIKLENDDDPSKAAKEIKEEEEDDEDYIEIEKVVENSV